jgi:hypothetical protein
MIFLLDRANCLDPRRVIGVSTVGKIKTEDAAPARNNCVIISRVELAGPSVAMNFVRLCLRSRSVIAS